MPVQNISGKVITDFVFKGFDTVQNPLATGIALLLVYIVAMIANVTNMYIIIMDKRLHRPMYLFICHLAVVDIFFCTSACPTMIGILLVGYKTISYVPCIVQMYVFNLSTEMEMFAISIMAFDRIVAIGNPLKYHSVLTNVRCVLITVVLWMVGCVIMTMLPATVVPLPVCYSEVKYMFCDYAAVTRTTCVNPEPYFNNASILTSVLIFVTFSFICLSYLKIAIVIVKMPAKREKKKAINTCVSHLIVIVCFYAPVFVRIVMTRIGVVLTLEERNGLMVGSILGPSLVNPFIYCFRNKEIRNKLFIIMSQIKPSD